MSCRRAASSVRRTRQPLYIFSRYSWIVFSLPIVAGTGFSSGMPASRYDDTTSFLNLIFLTLDEISVNRSKSEFQLRLDDMRRTQARVCDALIFLPPGADNVKNMIVDVLDSVLNHLTRFDQQEYARDGPFSELLDYAITLPRELEYTQPLTDGTKQLLIQLLVDYRRYIGTASDDALISWLSNMISSGFLSHGIELLCDISFVNADSTASLLSWESSAVQFVGGLAIIGIGLQIRNNERSTTMVTLGTLATGFAYMDLTSVSQYR